MLHMPSFSSQSELFFRPEAAIIVAFLLVEIKIVSYLPSHLCFTFEMGKCRWLVSPQRNSGQQVSQNVQTSLLTSVILGPIAKNTFYQEGQSSPVFSCLSGKRVWLQPEGTPKFRGGASGRLLKNFDGGKNPTPNNNSRHTSLKSDNHFSYIQIIKELFYSSTSSSTYILVHHNQGTTISQD